MQVSQGSAVRSAGCRCVEAVTDWSPPAARGSQPTGLRLSAFFPGEAEIRLGALWAATLQRKEPVAAAGRTPGQRHQADIQLGSQCRHECQQCVGHADHRTATARPLTANDRSSLT
jgi:hypothetical protein